MLASLALVLALTADRPIELVFGGDVALGRVLAGRVVPIGGDEPLGPYAHALRTADLAIVNLEGVLFDGPLEARDGIRLVAPGARAKTLSEAGIDLVSLANNHALDAGLAGLGATEAALDELGVHALGAGRRTLLKDIDGVGFAFIAVTDRRNVGARPGELAAIAYAPGARLVEMVRAEIARLDGRAAAVIVLVHWGQELSPGPTRRQRAIAHALLDLGVALVVGHGPHVVHEVERRGRGVIAYSLGNLVFDMRAPATRERVLAHARFDRRGALIDFALSEVGASADQSRKRRGSRAGGGGGAVFLTR